MGGGGGGNGTDRVASTLLALLDGIGLMTDTSGHDNDDRVDIPGNVVILATTSNPTLLDPALIRAIDSMRKWRFLFQMIEPAVKSFTFSSKDCGRTMAI